jgi:hypothetical protein
LLICLFCQANGLVKQATISYINAPRSWRMLLPAADNEESSCVCKASFATEIYRLFQELLSSISNCDEVWD